MIDLIRGDCVSAMSRMLPGTIDLVLTDPPYGMSFRSNHRKDKYTGILNDDSLGWVDPFVDELYRVVRADSAIYSFCSFHHIEVFKRAFARKFKIKNLLVWEKNNTSMGDLRGDFAPKVEFVLFAVKGRPLIRGKRDPNIFRFRKTKNEYHPTQKPVDLLKYLISKFSDPGQIVFDPFMGSGSTGVAAVEKGRGFIGVELDDKHYDTAYRRIIHDTLTSDLGQLI